MWQPSMLNACRFLLDLEARLGQNVVMQQIGDLVLQHHAPLRRVYVPYITNMMYQETLLKRLMSVPFHSLLSEW